MIIDNYPNSIEYMSSADSPRSPSTIQLTQILVQASLVAIPLAVMDSPETLSVLARMSTSAWEVPVLVPTKFV